MNPKVFEHVGLAKSVVDRFVRMNPRFASMYDDLVQEAFIAIDKAFVDFDPSRGQFSTIATWKIKGRLSMIAKIYKRQLQCIDQDSVNPDTNAAKPVNKTINDENQTDNTELVCHLLASLDDRSRTIIEYYYGLNGKQQLNQVAIAKLMGKTKQYISTVMSAAMEKMKEKV